MNEKEFLSSIGINFEGNYSGKNSYVVDLDSSNDFSKVFSLLEKSELEEEDESSMVTLHNTLQVYKNDEFEVTLLGDLDQDEYKLVVKER